ncbi:serine/threonine-protein kinase [Micromonospora andamanensis]|uniref:non-specific serine/threonine protein kinase n=1 Tax=Micromonospora andamanensis TaxID=1287068 RepID=A0ABQ4HUW5_9ACTN|nr:serine/threonine-protein kinase [Micromonospora andamanensis]GIJ09449.1 putative serine/threonine-protein kinase PknA [Micromonospora andamanensis]
MLSSEVVLSGRYRLDERVATGGMGDVWRATDLILGRQVAVKVLLPALVSDPDFIARFRAEARIMAALRHPGIVQVYDCGEDDLPGGGRADYLVMEFVTGQPLSKRIEAEGRLDVGVAMSVVAQAAQALHAAHLGGIVHRDVKPSNLLIQEDGTVVLVDFGVARSTNVTSITSTNAVPGTALYMAPEQAAGRPVSGATDLYALGAVAYCCLTGSPPFTGDNPLQVAVRHLDDPPPELPHDIPEAVRLLVDRALAKDPADRFSSGAAMAEAARAAVSEGSLPTTVVPMATALRDAGPDTRTGLPVIDAPPRQRRRGKLVGAFTAALVGLTALGAALGATQEANTPAVKLPTTAPTAESTDGEEASPSPQESAPAQVPLRPAGSTSRATESPSPEPSSPQPSEPSEPASPEPTTPSPDPEPTGTSSSPTPPASPTPSTPTTPPDGEPPGAGEGES